MGANQSNGKNIDKKQDEKLIKLREVAGVIFNTDIDILTTECNCDNLEIYTKELLLKNFTMLEIETAHGTITKKDTVYFKNKDKSNKKISEDDKKKMCIGISKYYKDIVDVFSLIVILIDKDYDYRKKKYCQTSLEKEDFKCLSILDKQLKILKLGKFFNINEILKHITIKEKDKDKEKLHKIIGIEWNISNNLYKKKYDFNKGKYMVVTYDQENDEIKIDEEYKNFIKKVYDTYSIGQWKKEDSKTPLLNYVNSVPFDVWWDDYLKKYSNNKKIPEPFNYMNFNSRPDESNNYNKKIEIRESFKDKYNSELEEFRKKKNKFLNELFDFLKDIIDLEGKPKISLNLTIEKLEEIKKNLREKVSDFLIEGQENIYKCLNMQIDEYKEILNKKKMKNEELSDINSGMNDDNDDNDDNSRKDNSIIEDLFGKNTEEKKTSNYDTISRDLFDKSAQVNNSSKSKYRSDDSLLEFLKNDDDDSKDLLLNFLKNDHDDSVLKFLNKDKVVAKKDDVVKYEEEIEKIKKRLKKFLEQVKKYLKNEELKNQKKLKTQEIKMKKIFALIQNYREKKKYEELLENIKDIKNN